MVFKTPTKTKAYPNKTTVTMVHGYMVTTYGPWLQLLITTVPENHTYLHKPSYIFQYCTSGHWITSVCGWITHDWLVLVALLILYSSLLLLRVYPCVSICDWISENRSKPHIISFEINSFKDLSYFNLQR